MANELFRTQFDALTGESKDIPLTKEEINDLKKIADQLKAEQLLKEEKVAARAALLERMGLTDEEAALLLG